MFRMGAHLLLVSVLATLFALICYDIRFVKSLSNKGQLPNASSFPFVPYIFIVIIHELLDGIFDYLHLAHNPVTDCISRSRGTI